ncbi:MAG TPA: ATP-binding protein [Solirubrobacteraceae bacterium]|nr:ATP-binding protein [Solirubrobacteraceae bacterium]
MGAGASGDSLGAVPGVALPGRRGPLSARARRARPSAGARPPALRRRLGGRRLDIAWGAFALANYGAMIAFPAWETIPFHFVWISLTLLYGFRVWPMRPTLMVLACVMAATGASIGFDAFRGIQLWGELFEVPLMAAMFLAMVWHARRRVDALDSAERSERETRALLSRMERFVHDASHELRTPVTIARGHLELLARQGVDAPEARIALDELGRMEALVERLLMLARADQPDFLIASEVDLELLLEDVLMRWSELAPRAWRLGPLAAGRLLADADRLRAALDALIENAVKYSAPGTAIELRARYHGHGEVWIEVQDEGCGVPADALERIFDRFARVDPARNRADGGVGLGLAIVDAIARAHGGECGATSGPAGSTFVLRLPNFTPAHGQRSATPAQPARSGASGQPPRGGASGQPPRSGASGQPPRGPAPERGASGVRV